MPFDFSVIKDVNMVFHYNCLCSLVRLALSSNFPGGLLSAAQSYPSLAPNAPNALTFSLTSTSSESEQVTTFSIY